MWPWIIALAVMLAANGIVAWFEIREANRTIDWATPDNLRTLYMVDKCPTTHHHRPNGRSSRDARR